MKKGRSFIFFVSRLIGAQNLRRLSCCGCFLLAVFIFLALVTFVAFPALLNTLSSMDSMPVFDLAIGDSYRVEQLNVTLLNIDKQDIHFELRFPSGQIKTYSYLFQTALEATATGNWMQLDQHLAIRVLDVFPQSDRVRFQLQLSGDDT